MTLPPLGRALRAAAPLVSATLWLIPIGRDEAQRRAAEELAKAKYGGLPPAAEEALDRLEQVIQRLVDILAVLLGGGATGSGFGIGGWMVVLVVLLVAALLVWRFGVPRWSRRRRSAVVDLESARAPADYRLLAEEAAASGEWRSAVRDRFRAVVRELESRTILDARPARTGWEAATRAAQVLPACRESLLDAADLFNAVMFGDRAATASDYRTMVSLDESVVTAADDADLAEEPALATPTAGAR